MKPILKYPGGKWRLAEWIIEHMPPHTGYVEPFFGSGAVFFNKAPCKTETINDLNGEIVNYFRVMRERPIELARAVQMTPWAREELEYCRTESPVEDSLEMARRFLAKYYQSIGSGADVKTGWKHRTGIDGGSCATLWKGMPSRIIEASKRILHAQIENRPAVEVIREYDGEKVLMYVDPPYIHETRTANIAYEYEMTDADHEELLSVLSTCKGMVLLSGYDSPMYRDLLGDWSIETINTRAERAAMRTECLWINPAAMERTPRLL